MVMTTEQVFKQTYDELMAYSDEALREIAASHYDVILDDSSKEAVALDCATLEVYNYVR